MDTVSFSVNNGFTDSQIGTITFVGETGAIVGEDFLLNNAGWKITGNKIPEELAVFEPFSRGLLLNHYIYGSDDNINIDNYYYENNDNSNKISNTNTNEIDSIKNENGYYTKNGNNQKDLFLWYFEAPNRFLGNQGISYKGKLEFVLGAFSGNFTENNGNVSWFSEKKICESLISRIYALPHIWFVLFKFPFIYLTYSYTNFPLIFTLILLLFLTFLNPL